MGPFVRSLSFVRVGRTSLFVARESCLRAASSERTEPVSSYRDARLPRVTEIVEGDCLDSALLDRALSGVSGALARVDLKTGASKIPVSSARATCQQRSRSATGPGCHLRSHDAGPAPTSGMPATRMCVWRQHTIRAVTRDLGRSGTRRGGPLPRDMATFFVEAPARVPLVFQETS